MKTFEPLETEGSKENHNVIGGCQSKCSNLLSYFVLAIVSHSVGEYEWWTKFTENNWIVTYFI